MKVLITGGAGFIGSHTTDLLIKKNHSVTVVDNLEKQVHINGSPDYLNEKADYVWADVTEKSVWESILKSNEFDAIIHLASRVGIAQSMYEPYNYFNVNTLGTALMYQTLIENPELRRDLKIVLASSKTIYGEGSYLCEKCGEVINPEMRTESDLKKCEWDFYCPTCNVKLLPVGIKEEKPPQNLSIYALTKYDTERMALNFGDTYGIPTIAFRYFNVYGPRQSLSNPYTGVSAIFSSRIKNNKPIILFEDGRQMRDFIYVTDVAQANLLALESDKCGVYNVGTGNPASITEIAQTLKSIFKSDVDLDVTHEFRKGDTRHDFADVSKIKNDLNFKSRVELDEGLKKLVKWSEKESAQDRFESAEIERRKYMGN